MRVPAANRRDGEHDPGPSASHDHGPIAAGSDTSITRALSVIEVIVQSPEPVSLRQIATQLGISKPTVYRSAHRLEELGYLERDVLSRRFVEGPRLTDLALNILESSAKRSVRRQILYELSSRVGETVNVGVLDGTEVVYLDRIETAAPLGLRFSPGSRVPAHCTAMGKLLLSFLEGAELQRRLAALPLQRYTANSITDIADLRHTLERIRTEQIATDNEEFIAGVVCVAVPVRRADGRTYGGLAIQVPKARSTLTDLLGCVPELRAAADKLGQTYGSDAQASLGEQSVTG